jgi:perosamine synthetase
VRVVAIIQARMGSRRLPGKSLADIAGQPLLGHVIDRVRASRYVTRVVVATTADPADRAIAELAARKGVDTYSGSADDVLDRYYQAARQAGAELVVRITADDPFKDPAIIDRVIARLVEDPSLDYASNCIEPTFAEGLDVECFTFGALEAAWRGAALPSERQHVTPYLWKHPGRFRAASVTQNQDHSALRWTIDYPEDLQFAREVYSRLYRGKIFGADEILALLEREPRLRDINAGRQRNAGYLASLQSDSVTSRKTVQRIGKRESDYVREVLEAQFRSSAGSLMTKRLEEAFARRFDCKYAISFANGTATMHAALAAAGIGAGDEVIVPPLTMASTAFCVLHAGATPVFADVHPDTWTIDPRCVAQRITPRTKAVIPVALYGLAPELDELMALARAHNLFLLEDDAQCFLGRYRGRIVGSIGHAASFSFQSSKHMTSGEGGMVITNDEALATRVRRLGSLGYGAVGSAAGQSKISRDVIQDPGYLRHSSTGWNYRISDLCSAVLLAQLERLDELVAVRTDAARAFSRALEGCDWLIPQRTPEGCEHAYWTFACRLAEDLPFTWQQFRSQYLKEGGDAFYGAWALNYLEPALKGKRFAPTQSQSYEPGLCPVAEKLQPRLVQFKTNYFEPARRELAAHALARTIAHFGAGR